MSYKVFFPPLSGGCYSKFSGKVFFFRITLSIFKMTSAQMGTLIGWLGLGYPLKHQRLVCEQSVEQVGHL